MMSKVIRISDSIFSRLQQHSTPLVDTPATVIERMIEYYEQKNKPETIIPVSNTNVDADEVGLYLAPASDENLQATIVGSKQINIAKENLQEKQYKDLSLALKGRSNFKCWAMTKNSRSKYSAMKNGDWVLFTSKGTGRFTYCGRVVHKQESLTLGHALWSVVPGLPWELIYFLDDVTRINVPKENLVSALGYDSGYVVPGIIRVSSARTQAVINQYGNINELLASLSVKAKNAV